MTRVEWADYRYSLAERKWRELDHELQKLRDRLEWAELPSLFIHENGHAAAFAAWLDERSAS